MAPRGGGRQGSSASARDPRPAARKRTGASEAKGSRPSGKVRLASLADDLDEEWGYAEEVVRRARKMGASSAEAFLQSWRGVGVDLEGGEISSLETSEEWGVGIRVTRGKGLGFAYYTAPGKRDTAIRQALRAAELVKRGGHTFSPGGRYPSVGRPDARIPQLSPEDAPGFARELIDGAKGVSKKVQVAGGGIGWGEDLSIVVSSEGASIAEHATAAGCAAYVVLKGRATSTGFEGFESRAWDFDVAGIGAAATRLAKDAQGGRSWGKPRHTTVLMRPEAAAQLFEYTVLPALHGDKVGRDESHYAGKKGKRVASATLSLTDDPRRSGALGASRADDEGEPSKKVTLVEDGVLKRFAYDRASAAEFGGHPTASALRYGGLSDSTSFKETPKCGLRNVVVEGKNPRPLDKLMATVEDGILVNDLLGAHTANATSGDFSVSSSQAFRIERGEVVGPLKTVMLAGNFFDAVKRVKGVGRDRRETSGHFSPVHLDVPWIALGGVNVVGQ